VILRLKTIREVAREKTSFSEENMIGC